jgi:hypothetical protein
MFRTSQLSRNAKDTHRSRAAFWLASTWGNPKSCDRDLQANASKRRKCPGNQHFSNFRFHLAALAKDGMHVAPSQIPDRAKHP